MATASRKSPSGPDAILVFLAQTLNVASLATAGAATASFTATGAIVGDGVVVSPRAILEVGSFIKNARVSAANVVTLSVEATNSTAAAHTNTLDIYVIKQ